jgi:hypothetical protein
MSRIHELDIPECVDAFFRKAGLGRLRILFLTFQFDPAVFEAKFDRLLQRPGIRIDVVAGEPPTRPKRSHYFFWQANWRGTFHPKMAVLLAGANIAVGLGSANLTSGGLGTNLECWQFFGDTEGDLPVLAGVRAFLEALRSGSLVSNHLEIKELIEALPRADSHCLAYTLRGQLLDQVAQVVGSEARRLDIISPLNCDPALVVSRLRQRFKPNKICLYSRTHERFPHVPGCDECFYLRPPEPSFEEDSVVRRLGMPHAKMYAFYGKTRVDLFWGSANLSASAWVRTGHKANVDFLVHSRVSAKEWTTLRDKLPAGYRWRPAMPTDEEKLLEEVPLEDSSFRLLNAVWDGRRLWLESDRRGVVSLWLRTPKSSKRRFSLKFGKPGVSLGVKEAKKLGFGPEAAPEVLDYAVSGAREWQQVVVNSSTRAGLTGPCDVASLLSWQYAGRGLPMPTVGGGSPRPNPLEETAEPVEVEEEELTQCLHQGALDRFVLVWRLNVRRMRCSSGQNRGLLRERITHARRLVKDEAVTNSPLWPKERLKFVQRLFKEALEEG